MADVTAGFVRADDGLQLYYRTIGTGPPLVCCNGVGVSTFFWKYVAEHYRGRFTVILWDYRAHGLSGSPSHIPTADLSVERAARDLHTILEHLKVTEPITLMGHSMGCQVILEYTKQHQDRVRALVPMFGTFGRPLDTFMDFKYSRSILTRIAKLAVNGSRWSSRFLLPLYANPLAFDVSRLTGMTDRYYSNQSDMAQYMDHLGQMNPAAFWRMVSLLNDHDLEPFLPEIDVPVLVIAGEKDLFTPLHRSRMMVSLLPQGELMVVAEGSHAAIVEHPDTINRRLDRFFAERVFPAMPQEATG